MIEKIKQTIKDHKTELLTKYNVKEIGIFGSSVHREQTRKSDIDVLVELQEGVTLFDFMDIVLLN